MRLMVKMESPQPAFEVCDESHIEVAGQTTEVPLFSAELSSQRILGFFFDWCECYTETIGDH